VTRKSQISVSIEDKPAQSGGGGGPRNSSSFVPAGSLEPATDPLAEYADSPSINPLLNQSAYIPTVEMPRAGSGGGGGSLWDLLTPEQKAATDRARQRRKAEEQSATDADAQQAALEAKHGKLGTAGIGIARGIIDAILAPGALHGMQAEALGTVSGVNWLRDYGRDVGEASNAQSLMSLMGEVFGPSQTPRPGESALTPGEIVRRGLEEQSKAWPLLSGVSRMAGMAIPAIATAGTSGLVSGGSSGLASAGTALGRIGAAAPGGGLEGMSGGAQQAYEDARPLRDVLVSSLIGGTFGAGIGAGFAGAGEGIRRGISPGTMKTFAEDRFSKAIGMRGSEVSKLGIQDTRRMARDVMEHTLEDGTPVFPKSPVEAARLGLEELGERVGRGRTELGQKLGDMRTKVGAFIEDAAPELRPNAVKLRTELESVLREVDDPILKSQQGPLRSVIGSLDEVRTGNKLAPAPEPTGTPDIPAIPAVAESLDSIGIKPADAPKVQSAWKTMLGEDLTPEGARRLSGVPDAKSISVKPIKGGVEVEAKGDGVHLIRKIYEDRVHHMTFEVDDSGKGIGREILKRQVGEYDRLGIKNVTMYANDVGNYAWPRVGFEPADPKDLLRFKDAYRSFLERRKLDTSLADAGSLEEIANSKHGKEFLLSPAAPSEVELIADVKSLAKRLGAKSEKLPSQPAGSFDAAAERAGKLADTVGKTDALDSFLNRERKAVSLAERAKAENKLSNEVNDFLKQAQKQGAVYEGRVYRGTNETELSQIRESGRTTHTLSASTERDGAEHFAKKGGVLLEIEDHPVPMDGIAGSNTFNETLIPKGSTASIVGEREVDGIRVVTLKISPAAASGAKRRIVEAGVKNETVSLQDLLSIRKKLQEKVYGSNKFGSQTSEAAQRLSKMLGIVDNTVDETVDRAMARMDETTKGAYKALKKLDQSFIRADQIIQGARGTSGSLNRQLGNRMLSLSDNLMGAAAVAGDVAGGGGVFSAVKGFGSAYAHKLAREQGPAFFAALANKFAGRSGAGQSTASPFAKLAFELSEGRSVGHLVSTEIAGGREGQMILTELERARRHVNEAVESAGDNPEQREMARAAARDALAERLAMQAGDFDATNWRNQPPSPLQKMVHRAQILDSVSADVSNDVRAASALFPAADFELNTQRIKRLTKNARGPEAIGSIQARARDIFENAPPTVEGDSLRFIANEAMRVLSQSDTPQTMALGHEIAKRLDSIASFATDDVTRTFATRQAAELADALGSEAFGDAGRLYSKLHAKSDENPLSDPANAREVLRSTEIRGRLPSAIKELARSIEEAHDARAKLSGTSSPANISKTLSMLERRLAEAEEAVTLDGGPIGRIFDHFEDQPGSKLGQDAPDQMVANTVRPQMERLLPSLGGRERDENKPKPDLPKSKAELTALYKERLEALTENAVSSDPARIEAGLSGLPNVPPALASVVAMDTQERMNALLKDMPKPRQDIRGTAYDSLSSDQLRVANAMWEATTKPLSVFSDFESGAIDYDKVSYAWKQYPGLKQAAQAGLLDAVHSHLSDSERASIPDSTLTQLDYLLGFNGKLQGSVDREFSARVSKIGEEEQQQKNPGGKPLELPGTTPTFTQRIASAGRPS
jgi:hypothetical protein